MQRVVPFLHTPLEAPEFLELWRETIRSGVARASEATTGGSGWKVTVKAGEVIIDGSWVYDDLDKIDGLDLGHVGGDKHYAVYQTYAYAGSDPPATSIFAVSGAVIPPLQPTIPAGAVKLCDIFVPASAGSIGTVPGINQQDPVQVSTTGVRFVQAPRLWPVQDTGELMDRLIMSVGNTLLFSQGAITFDDALGKLYMTQPVVIQTLCSTHRQFFNNAPAVVRTTVPAAPAGLTVPGTPGARDVIVYVLVDRSSPNTALAGTIKFLNRVAPGAPELLELMDASKRTQLVILGVISGAKMFMPGVQGQLPPPDADARKFLKDDPAGAHSWQLLDDVYFKGALKAGLADNTARDAIASDLRKQGLIAYTQGDDTFHTLAGGIANGDWKRMFDDNRLDGGFRVLSWTPIAGDKEAQLQTFIGAQVAAAKRKIGMRVVVRETGLGTLTERVWDGVNWAVYEPPVASFGVISGCAVTNPTANTVRIGAGEFFTPRGKKIIVPTDVDIVVTSANRFVYWDDDSATNGAFVAVGGPSSCSYDDMPFAYVSFDGTFLTKFVPCSAKWIDGGVLQNAVIVGPDAKHHFSRIDLAALWMSGFNDDNFPGIPRVIRVNEDSTLPGLTTLPAYEPALVANIDISGNVSGASGMRFKRDLAVGDLVRVNSATNWVVASIASDTVMTLSSYTGGALVGASISRCDHASSYAPSIDLTLSMFNAEMLASLTITGPEWSDNGRPVITWGSSTYGATKPLLDLNGAASWTIDSIQFNYGGAYNRVNHDCCFMKDPGSGLLMRRAVLLAGSSTRSLTHSFNLGANVGGDDSNPGMVIEQCSFDRLHGVGASHFYVRSNIAGKLNVRNTEFECSSIGTTDFDFWFEAEVAHGLDVLTENIELDSVRCAIFKEILASDYTIVEKKMIGCRLGDKLTSGGYRAWTDKSIAGGSIWSGTNPTLSAAVDGVQTVSVLTGAVLTGDHEGACVEVLGQGDANNNGTFIIRRRVSATSVEIFNPLGTAASGVGTWRIQDPVNNATSKTMASFHKCQILEGFDFIGAHLVSDCKSVAANTMNLRHGRFSNCHFPTWIGKPNATLYPTQAHNPITFYGDTAAKSSRVDWESARKESYYFLNQARSGYGDSGVPSMGLQVFPDQDAGVAKIQCAAEDCVVLVQFPDGELAGALVFVSFGAGEINIETELDIATGAVAVANKLYYVFARKAGPGTGAVDGFRYSSRAPQINSALNAADTPEGSRTREDYCYQGCVMTGPSIASDPWGDCRVTYLGNGLRRVTVSGTGNAPFYNQIGFISSGAIADGLSSLNAGVPTALEFEIETTVTVRTPSNAGGYLIAKAVGGPGTTIAYVGQNNMAAAGAANSSSTIRQTPRRDVYKLSGLVGGTIDGVITVNVISFVENVRMPIPFTLPAFT